MLVVVVVVLLCLPDAPARQYKTVEMRRHTKAAHIKAKAFVPMSAFCPLWRNLSRPRTYAAVIKVAVRSWKNNPIMFNRPER